MKLRMLLPAVLATVAAVSCGRGVPSPVDSVDTHIMVAICDGLSSGIKIYTTPHYYR